MGDASPPDEAVHNLPVLTVGELSQALKRALEDGFALVRVRGEISSLKRAASGHLYFCLKDTDAVLDAVCWRTGAQRLGLKPEDGMEVIATGRITTYAQRSRYQLVVDALALAGEGALLKLLEDRRKKLAAEGLFDAERKKPLPFLPEVIGVVTSPTGAVIRDILHRLSDRFPRRVLLWPVAVQGDAAAGQIAAAIAGFNRLVAGGRVPRPDLLIVARGGGSLEDLWAFNEEVVVRAAAASAIPLIAAVGHETDTTLIDFAADKRAPTPSAAAEMAVPVRIELMAQVMACGGRLTAAVNRTLAERRKEVAGLARALPNLRRLLVEATQRFDDWSERLTNSLKVGLESRRSTLAGLFARLLSPRPLVRQAERELRREAEALRPALERFLAERANTLDHAGALLDSCSYARVLERGFALVSDQAGEPVTSAAGLDPGAAINVRMHDGAVAATVTAISRDEGVPAPLAKPRRARKRRPPGGDDPQGSLL